MLRSNFCCGHPWTMIIDPSHNPVHHSPSTSVPRSIFALVPFILHLFKVQRSRHQMSSFRIILFVLFVGLISNINGAQIIDVNVFADAGCTQPYNSSLYNFAFNNYSFACSQAPAPGSPTSDAGITAINAVCTISSTRNSTNIFASYFNTSAAPTTNQSLFSKCPNNYPYSILIVNVRSILSSTSCFIGTLASPTVDATVYVQAVCEAVIDNHAMPRVVGRSAWIGGLLCSGMLFLFVL